MAPCDAPGLGPDLVHSLVVQAEEHGQVVLAEPPSGPLFDLFSTPRSLLLERLRDAQRLEDLSAGARRLKTEAEGLNVNEPSPRAAD